MLIFALLQQTPRMPSSSCTSQRMSPLSSSTAFKLLFHLPLVQFAAMCPVFPQHQQTPVSPVTPFSCQFLTSLTLAAVEIFLYTCLRSIHLWLLLPCRPLALRVQMLFHTLLRILPLHLFFNVMVIFNGVFVSIFHPG